MTKIAELADDVRILELELRKVELGNRLTRLKAESSTDDMVETIIKKQNQTLLHIKAELEAIKQCDPFDMVLIAGFIENISNMIKGETDPIFDEGCIGCAGPCNVVDVAANLQEEIDKCRADLSVYRGIVRNRDKIIEEYKGTIRVERIGSAAERINTELEATIEDLKDSNIDDLKELYDICDREISRYKHILSARDLTIKSLTTICQSSGTERNKLVEDLRSVKADYDIMRTNHYHSVAKLQGDIRGLEAELSARKEDSAVLMKVVEIVKKDNRCPTIINQLADLLVDYLDAPEGPPETPIDDLYKVTVSYAILEMP